MYFNIKVERCLFFFFFFAPGRREFLNSALSTALWKKYVFVTRSGGCGRKKSRVFVSDHGYTSLWCVNTIKLKERVVYSEPRKPSQFPRDDVDVNLLLQWQIPAVHVSIIFHRNIILSIRVWNVRNNKKKLHGVLFELRGYCFEGRIPVAAGPFHFFINVFHIGTRWSSAFSTRDPRHFFPVRFCESRWLCWHC